MRSHPTAPIEDDEATGSWAARCLFLYWMLLLVATHWPKIHFPHGSTPDYLDKLVHFGLYATLAGLIFAVLTARRLPRGASLARRFLLVVLIAVVYGAIDEVTQPWTGRDCDVFDWMSDACGTVAGASLAAWFQTVRTSLPLPRQVS
jgi:VanZ family protein